MMMMMMIKKLIRKIVKEELAVYTTDIKINRIVLENQIKEAVNNLDKWSKETDKNIHARETEITEYIKRSEDRWDLHAEVGRKHTNLIDGWLKAFCKHNGVKLDD